MKQAESIDSNIISSIFKRHTRNGNTSEIIKPFQEFPDHIKNEFLLNFRLFAQEQPSLMGFVNYNYWFVITNNRLFWKNEKGTHDILLSNIKKAEMDRQAFLSQGLSYKEKNKLLKITLKNNEILFLDVCESGNSFFAILNVFRWISSKNN
ncbi:MAG: hypothetical protein ACRC80_14935 [Waterburya sp.]